MSGRIEVVEPAASAASAAAPAGMKALLTTVAGSISMVGGGLTSNDVAVIGGLLATAVGLIIQIGTTRRRERREQAEERRSEAREAREQLEHAARMRLLESSDDAG